MWTILGPVPIDQVAPGDLVLAIHEHSGEVGFYPVSDLIVTDGAATNAVTLFHDTGDSETLDVTDVYPFWIESRGDARGPGPAGWARADTLAPGDTVRTLAGLARVESIIAEARLQRVHNLSVAGARTFLVGENGIWTHNCNIPWARVDLDALYKAAGAMDTNHFNRAGRALQKHFNRDRSGKPNPWKITGKTAEAYNEQGLRFVMEVLTNPATTIRMSKSGKMQFRLPDGRGVQFQGTHLYSFMDP